MLMSREGDGDERNSRPVSVDRGSPLGPVWCSIDQDRSPKRRHQNYFFGQSRALAVGLGGGQDFIDDSARDGAAQTSSDAIRFGTGISLQGLLLRSQVANSTSAAAELADSGRGASLAGGGSLCEQRPAGRHCAVHPLVHGARRLLTGNLICQRPLSLEIPACARHRRPTARADSRPREDGLVHDGPVHQAGLAAQRRSGQAHPADQGRGKASARCAIELQALRKASGQGSSVVVTSSLQFSSCDCFRTPARMAASLFGPARQPSST